jgi:hypothetical protein
VLARAATKGLATVRAGVTAVAGLGEDSDLVSAAAAEVALRLVADAVPRLRLRFERPELDDEILGHFVERGMDEAPESSEKEKALVKRLEGFEGDRDDGSWSRLRGTVREPVSYFKKLDTDGETWAKASAVVDASAADVLAWSWHFKSHERNRLHEASTPDGMKMELEVPGTRSKIMGYEMKMPGTIRNRVFVNWYTWCKAENSTDLILAFAPYEGEPARN